MRFKHPVPVDLAEQYARIGSKRGLRRHYGVGMNAVRRWIDETPGLCAPCRRPKCSTCGKVIQTNNKTGLCLEHYKELRRANIKEVPPPKRRYYLSDIITHTATAFGIGREIIIGASRCRAHVRPRQIAFYLARHMTDLSHKEIGNRMSKDHSTVIHGIGVIAGLMRYDRELRTVVSGIIRRVKGNVIAAPEEPIRLACMGHQYKRHEKPRPVLHFSEPEVIPDDDMELLSMAVRNHYAAGKDCLEVY